MANGQKMSKKLARAARRGGRSRAYTPKIGSSSRKGNYPALGPMIQGKRKVVKAYELGYAIAP